MIKVGVIGYGYSAKTFHIPLIMAAYGLELTAISSSQQSLLALEHPDVMVLDTPEALISSGVIDLVIITAPNDVHYSLAQLALMQGLHVVVEKPMVTTSAEAQKLVELAEQTGLILSVFHNRRWDGDFLTVKKLIENNAVGELRFFESHFDRFRPQVKQRWREQPGAGSGIWFDLGSHLVDQSVNLFGLPEAVTARCLASRDGAQTTDYFHVMLHYQQLEVVLHAGSFSAAPNQRFRLEGTEGSFIKYGLDPQEEQLKQGLSPNELLFGGENVNDFGRLYSATSSDRVATEQGCYLAYYLALEYSILTGSDNPVKPESAVAVLKILELAERSSEQGKTLALS